MYSGSTLYWNGLVSTGVTAAYAVNGNDKHTVAVTCTGSPSVCSIRLEGSLDGANWFDVSGAQDASANIMFHVVDRPLQFARVNVTSLSGGTSPVVNVAYVSINSGGAK